MARYWEADGTALFAKRLGKTAEELGNSMREEKCPEIWQLDNGDIAVIGSDLTAVYEEQMPEGVSVGPGERLVVIPGNMLSAAKEDIPDA